MLRPAENVEMIYYVGADQRRDHLLKPTLPRQESRLQQTDSLSPLSPFLPSLSEYLFTTLYIYVSLKGNYMYSRDEATTFNQDTEAHTILRVPTICGVPLHQLKYLVLCGYSLQPQSHPLLCEQYCACSCIH